VPLANKPGEWLVAAALYAAAEIGVTLTIGRFFDWGRAEALLFLGFRPWLLLAASLLLARQHWRFRLPFYAAALLLASVAEGLALLSLGAPQPWPEIFWGAVGAAPLVLLIDLAVRSGQRRWGRAGRAGMGMIAAAAMLLGGLSFYEDLVVARGSGQEQLAEAEKPSLLMMTSLPIIWGDAGAFTLDPRPAQAYTALLAEFRVTPLDVLDGAGLAGGRLLLVAQPRRLDPAELVLLDRWVREGGRALILTDPMLLWPSDLPLGDVRRPPPAGLLGPLLAHWGLRLDRPAGQDLEVRQVDGRKLALAAPGHFSAAGGGCRLSQEGLLADCRIGKGRALLVADADLLHDSLWTVPGPSGSERHRRIADNPLLVADWLDRLGGLKRGRAAGEIAWSAGTGKSVAIIAAMLPILFAALFGVLLRLRRKS
jgi:hypothetical protein